MGATMKRMIILFTFFCTLLNIQASEVDNFTLRGTTKVDAMAAVNAKSKMLLDQAIAAANKKRGFKEITRSIRRRFKKKSSGDMQLFKILGVLAKSKRSKCNKFWLYYELQNRFSNHLHKNSLAHHILHDADIPKRTMELEDSIYGDWTKKEAFVIGGGEKGTDGILGAMLKMGEFEVGSDKFEHFLGMGFYYFFQHYVLGLKMKNIPFAIGNFTERYVLGATMTGVYAWADMAANFGGIRFWNAILGEHPDILRDKKFSEPYVSCNENGKWVKNKDIDWAMYVDASWDQAINCSAYRAPSHLKKVLGRITKAEIAENKDLGSLTCPVNKNSLEDMKKKYGRFSEYIFNPHDKHYSIK